MTTSQLDIRNKSQEVSPFPAGDHKASINRGARKHNQKQERNNIKDPQKKHRLGTVSKNTLLEGINRFHSETTSPLVQMWIKTHRCLVNLSMHHLPKHYLEKVSEGMGISIQYKITKHFFLQKSE